MNESDRKHEEEHAKRQADWDKWMSQFENPDLKAFREELEDRAKASVEKSNREHKAWLLETGRMDKDGNVTSIISGKPAVVK